MDKLPTRYVPDSIASPPPKLSIDQVVYACGYEEDNGSFGMWAGPSTSLLDMLERVPDEPENMPCIIRFNPNDTDDVLYRWFDNGWNLERGLEQKIQQQLTNPRDPVGRSIDWDHPVLVALAEWGRIPANARHEQECIEGLRRILDALEGIS